jgi:hypothetical protein
MTQLQLIQFQKKQEAKFLCSRCGAERGCDCNAPAVEKLFELRERERQKKRRQRQKSKQNNHHVPGTDEIPTAEEADEDWQQALYDQACLLLARMGDATRQKLFAFIRRTYS